MLKLVKIKVMLLGLLLLALFLSSSKPTLAQAEGYYRCLLAGDEDCIATGNCVDPCEVGSCDMFDNNPTACTAPENQNIPCVCSGINWSSLYRIIQPIPQPRQLFFTQSTTIGDIISLLLTYIFPIIGLVLLVYLIYGGFKFLLSAGNPDNAKSAQQVITMALVGFIIIFVSYWVVKIAAIILGIGQISSIF
ncbi:hypothetical protein A3A76_02245 [Candidatus Woesebacteria bacterium RIFCSPLOWO2_01_FULL_39_23]|uniref:Yip1 domain-containing protein n=1 Tax=Candidatus Woesebacteria bacterium RIFCSPHIGHO2_01_FULL_40_22 TaxID=1802499 RepID=A0A1F7YFW2_9BACT|nr:MAG: hypothetical protein A2141_03400 [Candidatus Woesebacteria bacterium RBG_16_40_11]OGM26221.1 MAG: hypothetical protein A2628_02680 [Candidatus Woesebacteria bacterium RIFCSPHIGHO2_01_FULL_40_22]OGM36479.1 MAG: hypothetical protein A3E41_00500 [Candidatus Woesebacteria bacterium RIFCSPHIGHO2_12_FULL_38_9]OGM62379.1 MAG: hypothetical protein A3A76_02245 [Candidatus Woesebacteria bacterium RIFCSPLOWO2_01_FULL_39_23]